MRFGEQEVTMTGYMQTYVGAGWYGTEIFVAAPLEPTSGFFQPITGFPELEGELGYVKKGNKCTIVLKRNQPMLFKEVVHETE